MDVLQVSVGNIQNVLQPVVLLKGAFHRRELPPGQGPLSCQKVKMIEKAIPQFRLQHGPIQEFEASLLKRPERSYEIAAIDARHEPGRKRQQGLRVVPVKQVAAK